MIENIFFKIKKKFVTDANMFVLLSFFAVVVGLSHCQKESEPIKG